jgi:hypothetical protein
VNIFKSKNSFTRAQYAQGRKLPKEERRVKKSHHQRKKFTYFTTLKDSAQCCK